MTEPKKWSTDGLSGPPNRWECVGTSVYRCRDTWIWKEGREWWRTVLPCETLRLACASIRVSPLGGLFGGDTIGPFKTMREAKKGRRERKKRSV